MVPAAGYRVDISRCHGARIRMTGAMIASRDSDACNTRVRCLIRSQAPRPAAMRHSPRYIRAGHLTESRCLRSADSASMCTTLDMCATHTHTQTDDADYARCQMLYQRFSVTNTDAHAVSSHCNAPAMNGGVNHPLPAAVNRISYPQLFLPKGFHSRHPAQRRT